MEEENTQELDTPQPTEEVAAPEAVTDTPVPVEAEPQSPVPEAETIDAPTETPAEPAPAPDPLAELDAEIDALDVLDEDAVRGTFKKVLKTANQAHQRAEAAENRSKNAAVYAERDTAFSASAKKFGVSKIEVERAFDEQLAAVAKLGYTGDDARIRATARWEMVLESRKDKPAPTVRAATPANSPTVTRTGGAAIPRGGTAPPPPAPAKPIIERVAKGDYGALENLK